MKEKKKILSLSPLIYYPIVLEFCRKKRKRERGGREREREKSKGEKNKKGTFAARFRHRCLLSGIERGWKQGATSLRVIRKACVIVGAVGSSPS